MIKAVNASVIVKTEQNHSQIGFFLLSFSGVDLRGQIVKPTSFSATLGIRPPNHPPRVRSGFPLFYKNQKKKKRSFCLCSQHQPGLNRSPQSLQAPFQRFSRSRSGRSSSERSLLRRFASLIQANPLWPSVRSRFRPCSSRSLLRRLLIRRWVQIRFSSIAFFDLSSTFSLDYSTLLFEFSSNFLSPFSFSFFEDIQFESTPHKNRNFPESKTNLESV